MGLDDMHGNVDEWWSDWYDGKLAGGVDPEGPARGSDRGTIEWSLSSGVLCRSGKISTARSAVAALGKASGRLQCDGIKESDPRESQTHPRRQEPPMQEPGRTTVGIVLAGGGSTRLAAVAAAGCGKALLTFQGQTFLEHVIAAVMTEVDHVIVVAAPGQTLPALDGVRIVHDLTPGSGPLAGIRDGLRAALAAPPALTARGTTAPPPRLAVVASCDLPLLRREVVRLLLQVAQASPAVWTLPVVDGHRQVLVSVMRVELLPRIEAWLATGRRDLRGLVAELAQSDPHSIREVTEAELAAVDPERVSFVDIDTPDDLERLQSR